MTLNAADYPHECERPAIALEYAASPQAPNRARRAWQLVLSLPVLALPFLSFTYNVSPLDAVHVAREYWDWDWPITLLGSEFFVGPILLSWRAALLVLSSPRKAVKQALAPIAFLAWLPFICSCLIVTNSYISAWSSISLREHLVEGWPAYLLAAILILGVLIIAMQFDKGDKIGALTTSLTTPFLGTCTLCLLAFRSGANIGYWLTLYIVILWGAEFIWDGIHLIANRFRGAPLL